jgi:hypothetical protein
MTTRRDPDAILAAWLEEGPDVLPESTRRAIDVTTRTTHQARRLAWLPWRATNMNGMTRLALAAAAVVAVVVGGLYFLRPATDPSGVGGPGSPAPSASLASPNPTPEPSAADPTNEPTSSSSVWTGIPEGPFVVTGTGDPVQVTVNISSPGWFPLAGLDAVTKDDDGLDPPESVGAALLAWAWPDGTGFNVYGDPCRWLTTIPETPATTPAEIAAAFAAQASTDATAPVDVTVGGYAGKAITLHVPMSFDLPNASREEKFADCDGDAFAFYGLEGSETDHVRNAQGAGQVDELWIVDVDGSIVILDAALSPATPADLVEQVRTLAESATFEAP